MKLFSTKQVFQEQPQGSLRANPLPVSPIADESKPIPIPGPGESQTIPAQSPDTIRIIMESPYSWSDSDLRDQVKDLRINSGVKAWMQYDTSFRNWIYTGLSFFVNLPTVPVWEVPLPDHFRQDLGVPCIYFHWVKDGVISVCN